MRLEVLAFAMMAAFPASAADVSVSIHSPRTFGYFVGDLIHARVDVSAPADAVLSAASLPRPGPLTVSLDLEDVAVRETKEGDKTIWRLDLTYQNFYVALDVRNMEIPGFDLTLSTREGSEIVRVPGWSVGVAPLREIAPEKKESAEDYLRPDASAIFADETVPRRLALAFGVGALLALVLVARDRAWPPFRKRRARAFSLLARELAARIGGRDEAAFGAAIQSVHHAIDAANGAVLLADDLPSFFRKRPEFSPLGVAFERFFAASGRRFFGDATPSESDFGMHELTQFVRALAERERAG